MAEEGRVLEDRTREDVAQIKADLRQVKEGQGAFRESAARLSGTVEQIDRRISNLEQGQRRLIGLILGTWVTLALAILGLYARG